MSQENVNLVRGGYETFAATGELDTDLAEPSIEIEQDPLVPGQRTTYQGADGFAEMVASWFETFEGFGVRPREFLDAGDQVVVLVDAVGRGIASGVAIDEPWAHVWTLRDSKVTHLRIYRAPSEALEATGLSE
jgi:ketosteroid isomerase-like protein